MDKEITYLKLIGMLEGWSFLILLIIAMPLKYYFGFPIAVKIVGMGHGLLFMAFLWILYESASKHNLNNKFLFFGFLASVLPFGTFVFEKKLLTPEIPNVFYKL